MIATTIDPQALEAALRALLPEVSIEGPDTHGLGIPAPITWYRQTLSGPSPMEVFLGVPSMSAGIIDHVRADQILSQAAAITNSVPTADTIATTDPDGSESSSILGHPDVGEDTCFVLVDNATPIAWMLTLGAELAAPTGNGSAAPSSGPALPNVGLLNDVALSVTVELGRTRLTVSEMLGLTVGSVVELDRPAGAPVDLFANGTLIARAEVVVVDDEYGVRIAEIIAPG
ncbi:MAG: flagellar motor switch protein FliN [Actinomycetia bacterium]|nr:flagellar motor switch protein FliN [Actinomycetes bacterium]